jgi:Tfp pilus assembly protein PilF
MPMMLATDAKLMQMRGDLAGAAAKWDAYYTRVPQPSADAFVWSIIVARAQNDLGIAMQRAARGAEAFPNDLRIAMQRAEIAEAGEDLDLARDMYDRAILIRPQYAEAWNRRALLFFKDGKYDEAIADLEAVLRHEPRHFGAWISLAMIFESLDQPDAALHAYRKAVEIHPFASAAKEAVKRLIPRTEGRSF